MDTIEFSLVVEKIYDAAVDPGLWEDALLHLRRHVGGTSASLLKSPDPNAGNSLPAFMFLSGYDDAFVAAVSPEYWNIWSLQTGLPSWRVGEVHHLPDLMAEADFVNGRFYREVLQTHGQVDFLGMMALREGPVSVQLNVSTSVEAGSFQPEWVARMRLLAPHVCRAAKIGLALDHRSLRNVELEAALDSLLAGVCLVRSDGSIVFANRAAEHLARGDLGFQVVNMHLVASDAAAANALNAILCSARASLPDRVTRPVSVPLPGKRGGLIATVLPLGDGRRRQLAGGRFDDLMAVFLQDPTVMPPAPGDALAKLYGLTPAELRVLLTVAEAHPARETAEIMGLSLATVKSHLQHIFQKTGLSRQVDLVNMVRRASAPAGDRP